MSAAKDIAVALLPVVVTQIGEGIREELAARRVADRCEHGRPKRLCAKCVELDEKCEALRDLAKRLKEERDE